MNRTKLNAIVNILSLVLFLISLVSGLVLWQILPSGDGLGFRGGLGSRGRIFMNITRNEWLDLHNYSSILFACSVAVHCLLHWRWFKSVMKILGGES
ncbi:MAG: DUF4405 domain-containing protein [Candidatus Bathyarchaeia archaeon]|nr:DUF4405 domain-containing protein [Candidatus Bathyarchaeota archaeon]